MRNHISTLLLSACVAVTAYADGIPASDTLRVCRARMQGPYAVTAPYQSADKDAAGKVYDVKTLTDYMLPPSTAGTDVDLNDLTIDSVAEAAVGSLTFRINAKGYVKVSVPVSGLAAHKVLIDGKVATGETGLRAGAHRVEVQYLTTGQSKPQISVAADRSDLIAVADDQGKRPITLSEISDGKRISSSTLSSDGSMLLTVTYDIKPGGRTEWKYEVTDASTGARICTPDGGRWMPRSPLLYMTRNVGDDRQLYTVDPRTGHENTLATRLPQGNITVSPTEDRLVISTVTNGPAEGSVYQVLEPDDRQPGWRNRSSLLVRDLNTGVTRPLTFGSINTWLSDVSADGTKALVMSSHSRLERRPTTVFNIMTIDMATAKADTLVSDDGFLNSASFSPDGSHVLVTGTPEALGGIGLNVPEGRTPSMTDNQLFVIDTSTHQARPLTRNFNPSVKSSLWSRADGMIYLTAEDGDYVRLYRLDPQTGKTAVVVTGEDMVNGFSVADTGDRMAWIGQGASNSDRLYLTEMKRNRTRCLLDSKGEVMEQVTLGACEPWNYVNAAGDTIMGRYYLPADFDPTRKYPMIVNYYGGCSPTSRNFESRYPHHLYAANGYVVYVVNPSGCTGRGQEWASRHVNTAGEGVAEDIIEGTRRFMREHEWVDSTRIGCIGASYGGFMTQYLQTVTDLFAAAISHAGISGHTSYWGEGYWGYSYSEVSMANTYPWSHRDLYMGQSPIYNVDKIKTPLLFLHGDKDNNVPVGESIQMFTALKLLGRETAFVAVADQDHHILDYDKRIKWQDTIFAWFDKYLKGDSRWWDALYPPKNL